MGIGPLPAGGGKPGLFEFGAVAGGAFVVALRLLCFESRVPWALVARPQVVRRAGARIA